MLLGQKWQLVNFWAWPTVRLQGNGPQGNRNLWNWLKPSGLANGIWMFAIANKGWPTVQIKRSKLDGLGGRSTVKLKIIFEAANSFFFGFSNSILVLQPASPSYHYVNCYQFCDSSVWRKPSEKFLGMTRGSIRRGISTSNILAEDAERTFGQYSLVRALVFQPTSQGSIPCMSHSETAITGRN